MANGVVIPTQTTDAGKQQVKSALDNLGSQMSQLVQSYNDLRTKVEGEPSSPEFKAKMHELFEQRRAAIRDLVESFRSTAQSAAAQGITANNNIPTLQGFRGLGAGDLGGLQTAVATEQSKLSALAVYYEQAKAAVAAGQPVPPVPAELSGGFMGISAMWLAIGAVVVLFFFMKK